MAAQMIQSIKKYYSRFRIEKYHLWLKMHEHYPSADQCEKLMKTWTVQPMISILLPVYKTNHDDLKVCIQSVMDQVYPRWELCIVNDHSEDPVLDTWLNQITEKEKRIHYFCRSENGHIARASNDALAMASGQYIALLDHDDCLSPYALYRAAEVINLHPDTDFIYSDEDKLTPSGQRCEPFFKPDWSPDLLLSQNYICHLAVIRKTLIDQVGGFEPGLDGAQDYDLFLKCTERTEKIVHIPELLYHWRMTEQSTAENPEAKTYAFTAGKQALENALERRSISGTVKRSEGTPGDYQIVYTVNGSPEVSIILHPDLSMDNAYSEGDFETRIRNLTTMIHRSGYDQWEIIIPNRNETPGSKAISEKTFPGHSVKMIPMADDISIAGWLNQAIKGADGEMLLILRDHVSIQSENWLYRMIGMAQRPHIGAVSPVILYPDQTIRQAGIVFGLRKGLEYAFRRLLPIKAGGFRRAMVASNFSAVSADCMMLSKEKFDLIGAFDEQRFSTCLFDADLCLQLRQFGFYHVCAGDIQGIYSGPKHRYWEHDFHHQKTVQQEIRAFTEKWRDQMDDDPFYNPNLTRNKADFSLR